MGVLLRCLLISSHDNAEAHLVFTQKQLLQGGIGRSEVVENGIVVESGEVGDPLAELRRFVSRYVPVEIPDLPRF